MAGYLFFLFQKNLLQLCKKARIALAKTFMLPQTWKQQEDMRTELGDKSFATGGTIRVHLSCETLQNNVQHKAGDLDISCYVRD